MLIYVTLPFGIYQTLTHYYSRPMDVNCIKKERYYLTGKYVSRNSPEISIEKLKQLGKKNNAPVGDVMMSITSVVLNDYFELHGDKQKELSLCVPFSFRVIPKKVSEYEFGNMFIGMTIYLKLFKKFEEALP
jgi:hypothetical protein